MPKKVKAWACEYCGVIFVLKEECVKHEDRCFSNPDARVCRSCANYPIRRRCQSNFADMYCDEYTPRKLVKSD